MSERDQDPPSHDPLTPQQPEPSARPGHTPAPGKRSLVEQRYGGVQRRSRDDAPAPAPAPALGSHLTTVPGSPMPLSVFDAFAVHLDPVQRDAEAAGIGAADPVVVHAAAARGLTGAATALPHADAIQRSFGADNDVSTIRAHVGGPAAEASAAMNASAYATGDQVAFAAAPDLHTAAHEAAHVIQQRAGVQLYGGVGRVGDPYEQHADAVADRVVAGQSAADLLAAGPGGGCTSAVQRKGAKEAELGDIAGGLLNVSPGVARIAEATADLELAKAKAERVLAQWQTGKLEAHTAAREVVHILGATIEPIGVLKDAVAHQAAMPNAIRQRDHEGREEAQALGSNRPVIFDALNNVARVVLEISRATADAPGANRRASSSSPAALVTHLANMSEVDAMNRMLDTVAAIARPIGWSPPANLEQANVVRFAFEACPPGSNAERPEDCALSDTRRVEARTDFYMACNAAHEKFKRATEKVKEPLEAMIKEEQKARSLVVDIAIGALDKALGAAIPGMPAVGDLVLGQAKDQLKNLMEDASLAEPIPGQGTVSMLDALLETIKEALATVQTTAKHLDDQAILAATKKVQQLDVPYFESRLRTLASAFGQQIDPIGRPRTISDELGLLGPSGTWDAVRVRLPAGKLRAAQVVRGSQPGKKPGQDRPVYNFVRWIDAQFGPMVEGAPIIDYTGINSLPLGEVLAP